MTPEEEKFQQLLAKLPPKDRENLQKILTELGEHQATSDVLNRQIELLGGSLSELSVTMKTIKDVKEERPDTEILVPLGSDSFIRAKMLKIEKVMIGLGAGVVAERSVEKAVQTLETRSTEVTQAIGQARTELEKLSKRIEILGQEIDRILAKSKKKSPTV